MYKFNIFMFHKGISNDLEKTLISLNNSTIVTYLQVILIFDEMAYELDKNTYSISSACQFPNLKIRCIYGLDFYETTIWKEIFKTCEYKDEIAILMNEGDTTDPHYFEYINYFFEENSHMCNVLLTPIVSSEKLEPSEIFVELPPHGLKYLYEPEEPEEIFSELPKSTNGVAILMSATDETIGLQRLEEFNFFDIILKAVLDKKCYGLINTAFYYSDESLSITIDLLRKISDYCMSYWGYLPKSVSDFLNEFIDDQFYGSIDNFDKDTLLLLKYFPERISDASIENEISIIEIKNYYNNVEIIGQFVTSAKNNNIALYITSNGLKSEITLERIEENSYSDTLINTFRFNAFSKLQDDCTNLVFSAEEETYGDITEYLKLSLLSINEGRINNFFVTVEKNAIRLKRFAARAEFIASCIIPVYNCETYLEEAIESVISQSIDFFSNIQLILVNDGSTDSSESICLKYKNKYPLNTCFISQSRCGVSAARNKGLEYAMGNYISFLDADDKLSPNLFEVGIKQLEVNKDEIDFVAFPIEHSEVKTKKPSLNYRFKKACIIDVAEKPTDIQCSVCGIVVNRDALSSVAFDERLSFSEDSEFMHRLILKKMKYGVAAKPAYLYRDREDNNSVTQNRLKNIEWYQKNYIYNQALIDYSLSIYDIVTDYTQHLIVHELFDNIVSEIPQNMSQNICIPEIFNSIGNSLKYVNDEIILSSNLLEYGIKYFLLKLKYGNITLKKTTSVPVFKFGQTTFEPLRIETTICNIIERDNQLRINGFYNLTLHDNITLIACYDEQVYTPLISVNRHKSAFFLGEKVHSASVFDFEIPVVSSGTIEFFMQYNGLNYPIKLNYYKNARINNKSGSFCITKTLLITTKSEENQLGVRPLEYKCLAEATNNYIKINFKNQQFNKQRILMNEYLKLFTYMEKNKIWLFFDSLDCAGNNAEFLFHYANTQEDEIDKYFVIQKNTIDAIRLEDTGKIVEYGSNKHKLLYLFAEKVIVSDTSNSIYGPLFTKDWYDVFGCVMKNDLVYLPQEILEKDISSELNVFSKDISFWAISSAIEQEKLGQCDFGYDKNVMQLTGLPKYDLLKSDDYIENRKIIFMPDWRKELYLGDNLFNFEFKDSAYCKAISELLCDKRLLNVMMEYEYEMCFIPHEKTLLQLANFDMYENVNVIDSRFSKYNLFNSSSLLITDYLPSFDFAYMKKPVIYYQFDESESSESFFHIESMGFGEIIQDHNTLVDLLIEYIKNDCAMKEKYLNRVDSYFANIDSKNCERIYSALKNAHKSNTIHSV